jgi:hypothetical protein
MLRKAGRACADDREGQKRGALFRVAFALGALEGDEDAAAKRGGVFQRLEARCKRLPLVMAEIGVTHAGREHQRVVGQRVAVFEQHEFAGRVDAADGGKQRRDVRPVAQEIADRPGDFGCREGSGRHLIEQRLKQMMIAAINECDLDARTLQPQRAFKPAKAGAHDHHAMSVFRTKRWRVHGALNVRTTLFVCVSVRAPRSRLHFRWADSESGLSAY